MLIFSWSTHIRNDTNGHHSLQNLLNTHQTVDAIPIQSMSKLNHNLKIIRQIKNRTNSDCPFSFTCSNDYSSLWCKGTQLKGNNKAQDYEKSVQLPKVHKNCSNNPFLFSKAPFILWDQFVYIISLYYSYYLILRIYFLPNTSSIKHSFTLKSCFSHTRHRPEPKYRSSPHHPVQ